MKQKNITGAFLAERTGEIKKHIMEKGDEYITAKGMSNRIKCTKTLETINPGNYSKY